MVGEPSATDTQRLFQLFADLLEYPQTHPRKIVRACDGLLSKINPGAVASLQAFSYFVEDAALGKLQELFTRTFDLDATYHPYVGHHLFGESYKRSAFMVGLIERYHLQGYDYEGELPDHFVVLLRYLAQRGYDDQASEIVHDAMVPALERMVRKFLDADQDAPPEARSDADRQRDVYPHVLQALYLALKELPVPDRQLVERS